MKARIKFRKYGVLKFIGHLDVMRYFQKVMRRAEIPIAFTGGFSPHMIMSFASPLGIGLESDGEYLDIELTEPIESNEAVRRMNEVGVEGIKVLSFLQIAEEKKMTGMTILAAADYLVTPKKEILPDAGSAENKLSPDWKEQFSDFMGQSEIRVMKQTKRSEREVDLRPLIYDWEFRGDSIFIRTAAGSTENLKPDLIMDTFLKFTGAVSENSEETDPTVTDFSVCQTLNGQSFNYRRIEMYADTGKDGKRNLVTLESLGGEIH